MGFALWLHLHMCNQTFLFFCQYSLRLPWRSPMVSSLSGWNISCVSLLWGIFWTSECFNPQVGQDRSVGTLELQEQSLSDEGCCCWRNTPLPGPPVGSSEMCSTQFPSSFQWAWASVSLSSDPFLTYPLMTLLPFQSLFQASFQDHLLKTLLAPKTLMLGLILRESKLSQ